MGPQLKKTISWTIYIVIAICIVGGVLIPAFITMIQPTFFPEADISGFISWMQTASIWVSFFSAALGGFSVWQATRSEKETKAVLDTIRQTINTIKVGQDELASFLHNPNFHYGQLSMGETTWTQDTVKE